MRFEISRKLGIAMLALCFAPSVHAGEWELGGSFAFGQESKGAVAANGNFPTVPYTIVQNTFTGAWNLGGLEVGYKVFRSGDWGAWLQVRYSEGVSHPGVYHSGENYTVGSAVTEVFTGNATYKSNFIGVAVTRHFPFGEFGISVGPRSHDLSVEGSRQNRVNNTFTYDRQTVGHTYRDPFVSLNFTATQNQGGFRSFQKISYGTGFGSSVPSVNPGPNDWRMSEAYLAQFRPNQEVRITLGVRL